jgi:hypothetical protein
MELQPETARGVGEIPRSWDQGGGHDPKNTCQGNIRHERAKRLAYIAYQVAAHITPLPRSCPLIVLNSKLMYCEKYRTKGRISRTPSYMTPKPVRTFRIVLEMDLTRCLGEFSIFDKLRLGRNQSMYELTLRYAKVGGGRRISRPHQSTQQTLDISAT